MRTGDTLIVTELDRLGRNKQDTLKELQYLRDKEIRVMILEIPTTTQDLSTLDNSMAQIIMETINNMLIELYATMAQAVIEKKEKRQQEGIAAKKARGDGAIMADQKHKSLIIGMKLLPNGTMAILPL